VKKICSKKKKKTRRGGKEGKKKNGNGAAFEGLFGGAMPFAGERVVRGRKGTWG